MNTDNALHNTSSQCATTCGGTYADILIEVKDVGKSYDGTHYVLSANSGNATVSGTTLYL